MVPAEVLDLVKGADFVTLVGGIRNPMGDVEDLHGRGSEAEAGSVGAKIVLRNPFRGAITMSLEALFRPERAWDRLHRRRSVSAS